MNTVDFKPSSSGFFCYKEPIDLWEHKVSFDICVSEDLLAEESDRLYDILKEEFDAAHSADGLPMDEYEALFEQVLDSSCLDRLPESTLPTVQELLGYIGSSRDAAMAALIEKNVHVLAQQWLEDAGQQREISPEQFAQDVFPISITAEFKRSLDSCSALLELGTKPDYFCGHRIHLKCAENKSFAYSGL